MKKPLIFSSETHQFTKVNVFLNFKYVFQLTNVKKNSTWVPSVISQRIPCGLLIKQYREKTGFNYTIGFYIFQTTRNPIKAYGA